jgi:hypothetical protein
MTVIVRFIALRIWAMFSLDDEPDSVGLLLFRGWTALSGAAWIGGRKPFS